MAQEFAEAPALDLIILDKQQLLASGSGEVHQASERLAQVFRRGRLDHVGERAVSQTMQPFFLHREDLDRNMSGFGTGP